MESDFQSQAMCRAVDVFRVEPGEEGDIENPCDNIDGLSSETDASPLHPRMLNRR